MTSKEYITIKNYDKRTAIADIKRWNLPNDYAHDLLEIVNLR